MDHIAEIVLPAGTQVVAVSDIPKLIAEALYPPRAEGVYTFKHLTKVVSRGPYVHTPPCATEELKTVSDVAGPPPQEGQTVSADELDAYLTRFNTSPQRPGWEIGASVVNQAQNAAIDRLTTEEQQKAELKRAIGSGNFVPLSHALVPLHHSIRDALDLGRVFVDGFRDYAAKFRILVRVEAASNDANVPLVETSGLLSEITDRILESNRSRWEKPGHNNDIRRDVARAFVERSLLDQLQARVAAGTISPRNPTDGRVLEGRIDFGFVSDLFWGVPSADAERFSRDCSVWPDEIDARIEAESPGAEERAARLLALQSAKIAASRFTVKEAIAELARATGIAADRWKVTLLEKIRKGELPLRNPYNFSDNLPYPVPKQLYTFIEQVDAVGINLLLDRHLEWNVAFRFPTLRQECPADREPAAESEASQNAKPPWVIDAIRIADEIALERFSRGEQEITARNICDAVATRLAKNPQHHGERGPRTGENVRNVALKGWKFVPPAE